MVTVRVRVRVRGQQSINLVLQQLYIQNTPAKAGQFHFYCPLQFFVIGWFV